MRPILSAAVLGLMLILSATAMHVRPASAGRHSTKTAVDRDGWPQTPAGALGRRWVAAFAGGEAAMREFNARELSAESLAKRGVEARLETYRKLHERLGKLMLASVLESRPEKLNVQLMAADATVHEFVFTVEKKAPYRMVSVGMMETRSGHGGFGFHH